MTPDASVHVLVRKLCIFVTRHLRSKAHKGSSRRGAGSRRGEREESWIGSSSSCIPWPSPLRRFSPRPAGTGGGAKKPPGEGRAGAVTSSPALPCPPLQAAACKHH